MNKFLLHSSANEQFNDAKPHHCSEWCRTVLFTLLTFLLLLSLNSSAQKIDAFARVSVTPREGVVRQPYKVTITVHSSTWFAKPLQFANLRIDDAFIIPFTRTVSSINYINNKKYATLSFYYLVFPYNTGTLEIPALEISASIPPEGGYKGEPVTIGTKPQIIHIKAIPSPKNQDVWMVAKNVTIKESWNKPLTQLRVGDVVEREITISASGTLPSLIQPFKIEKPQFTSIYPMQPVLQDKRNSQDVNGVRIENYSYLFEKEADVIFPREEIYWWNPETRRVYKRTLPKKIITIAANPNLAIMQSLKDSLMAMSAPVNSEVEETSFPWLWFGILMVLLVLVVYFGFGMVQKFVKYNKTKRALYMQSEAFYFRKVQHTLNTKSSKDFIRALYRWFDRARKPEQAAYIYAYLTKDETAFLESIFQSNTEKISSEHKKKLKKLLRKLQIVLHKPDYQQDVENQLNPV